MEMISARLLRRPDDVQDGIDATGRQAVARHYGTCARGVAADVAHERLLAFYRAGGQAWTRSLET
ncbi:MAG: hypothetical protein BroJett026_31340 [Betaproteobacteria bacterium]|nr:MAG: hypothetical protein BroJett026_31340 [Betaproteobacteria bacterium]